MKSLKYIISVLLAVLILVSTATPILAAGSFTLAYREYYRAYVHAIKENGSSTRQMDFMMPSTPKAVYVNAEQLAWILGYEYAQSYNECSFVDRDHNMATLFKFDSSDVAVYILDSILNYSAPVSACYIDGVAWVPFEFALYLFSSDLTIHDGNIVLTAPRETALTATAAIIKDIEDYGFDYVSEIGADVLTESQSNAYHALNFLDGLLTFEGRSWGTVLKQMAITYFPNLRLVFGNDLFESYHNAYVADVASLFVCGSEYEVDKMAAGIRTYNDIMSVEDVAHSAFAKKIDGQIGVLGKDVETLKELALEDSKLIETYSRKADLLDETLKSQNVFSKLTTGLKHTGMTLNALSWVLEVCDYYSMLNGREEFALDALSYYGKASNYEMGKAIDWYVLFEKSGALGQFTRFISENATKIAGSFAPLPTVAGAIVAGWSIARDNVGFIKTNLDKANSFAIYEYSNLLMTDCAEYLADKYAETFANGTVYESSIEDLACLTYTYLKFSYISRDAALGSIRGTSYYSGCESELTETNKEIAKYLAAFSSCGESAELGQGYGFLPSHVSAFNRVRNDAELIEALNTCALEKIVASSQNAVPVDEINPFPGEDMISEEEAIDLVKTAMSQGMTFIFDLEFLKDVYTFDVVGYYESEKAGLCYVIQIATYGMVEQTPFMVPADGSAVYIGMYDSSTGRYYCYSDVDMLHFSFYDFAISIADMMYKAENGATLEEIFS